MPWNPSDPNDKDPWGRSKKPQGPPDLDVLFSKYKKKVINALGGKNAGSSGKGNDDGASGILIGLVLLVVLVLWALFGIFIVSPSERAVVLRFGKYIETVGSGPHWIPRLISTKQVVNVESVMEYPYQSEMLTKDENIISAEITVFYRINDLEHYLFNVIDPISTLQQATASTLRQVVGHSTLDDLLTIGRGKVRVDVLGLLQETLNSYNAGLLVVDVNLQPFKPPQPVAAAFEDVIKAREDEESYINQAGAYSEQVLADARGRAARIIQDATAAQQQVVLQANAEVQGYLALLPEYRRSPDLMKERLYLGTLESVFNQTSKIFLDQQGGNPLLYLPLDKMTGVGDESAASSANQAKVASPASPVSANIPAVSPAMLGGIVNRYNQSREGGR